MRFDFVSPAALSLIAIVLSACSPAPDANSGAAIETFRDCPECPELLRIPAGEFMMGSTPAQTEAAGVPAQRAPNEHPAVPVTIERDFAIGRYEVTIKEFRAFTEATDFTVMPGCFGLSGRAWAMDITATWDAPGYPVDDSYPAACLTAEDYDAYLSWLSATTGQTYRMPTEAEWEYMAGLGIEQPPRNWVSADADACLAFNTADANFTINFDGAWTAFACDDGFRITSPVGHYPPNKLGMYDVIGNTAEITSDCFVAGHEGRPTNGAARTAEGCATAVFKGGSWAGEPSFLRPAFRVLATRVVRGNGFGLRVVRELDD